MRIKSPVLVGREAELARLVASLEEASAGRPSVVVISGEAGIGKSRLVEELSRVAAEQGARWLSGAAADYGTGGLPFGPVVEAFRPIPSARDELAALIPEAAAGPARGAGMVALSNGPPQVRLFEVLLDIVGRITAERPSVLVLEDLHWADASTRDFLAFLARNLGSARLLVVGTYRADDVGRDHPLRRFLAELERAGHIERLDLVRLGRDDLRRQSEAIRGERVSERMLDALYERSQGNPFFTEELLAATDRTASDSPSLSPNLRDILLARVHALASATRRLLEVAAVIGRAEEGLLASVTRADEAVVGASLRDAIEHFVLEPADQPDAGGYGFRHALVREAIYDDMLSGERVRLHRRVAEVMATGAGVVEGWDAQAMAQLAHHWQRSGRPNEAFVAAWRAGVAAERAYAYPEAAMQFERAADLWPQVTEPERLLAHELQRGGRAGAHADRAAVMERAADAASWAGDLRRPALLLEAAAAEVDPDADPDRAAMIQTWLFAEYLDAGDSTAAERAAAAARSLIGPHSAPAVRAVGLLRPAQLLTLAGRHAEALPQILDGLAAAQESGDADLLVEAHLDAAGSTAFLGRIDEATAHYAAARAVATAAGSPRAAAIVDKWQGVIFDAAARFDEALVALERSQVTVLRVGNRRTSRHNDAIMGQSLHRLGRFAEAEEALRRSLVPPAAEWGHVVIAYLLVQMGRLEDAERELAVAWESVRESGSTASYGPYFSALVEKHIWQGHPESAMDAAAEGMQFMADGSDLRWIGELSVLGARAAADAGKPGRATDFVAELRQRSRGPLEEGTIFEREARASLASAEAELGRARGAPDPQAWGAAASLWHALREPYPEATALYRQAEAALLGGAREEAPEPLRRALELARQMGAERLLAEVESLARRARLSQRVPDDQFGLTSREREVLRLLARGRTDRQIALELFISPKTASVHVSNIKGKLGVEHRIEAASVGLRLGLAEEWP